MSARRGPTFSRDAARATDATVDGSAREAAARGLVRGEVFREAAANALLRAGGDADEGDTGSALPADAASSARRATRMARRLREDRSGSGDKSPAPDGGDATGCNPGEETRVSRNWPQAPDGNRDVAPPGQARATRVTPGAEGLPPRQGSAAPSPQDGEARPQSPGRHGDRAGGSRNAAGRDRGSLGRRAGTRDRGDATPARGSRSVPRPHATSRPTGTFATWPARSVRRAPPAASAGRSVVAVAGRDATATGGVAALAVVALGLVALALLAALLMLLAGGAVEDDRLAGAHRLAQQASDEYLEGESWGNYHHKGRKYVDFVPGADPYLEEWSACFVTWCMGQAGFLASGLVGPFADAESYVLHFERNPGLGEVHRPGEAPYQPEEGDLFALVYASGNLHVGIVTSCDGTWFDAVVGNAAGGPRGDYDLDREEGFGGYVACRRFRLGELDYTFIHPAYSEGEALRALARP